MGNRKLKSMSDKEILDESERLAIEEMDFDQELFRKNKPLRF